MKLQKIRQGFTLIELLVVITIIGILATGWVSVFTTQLQGARDSTRVNDMKLMETAIHQYFNDMTVYPPEWSFSWAIAQYVSKELEDPKTGTTICWADSDNNNYPCAWYYHVWNDSFGLVDSAFKLGISFEKKVNFETKADNANDGWAVDNLFETFAGEWSSSFVVWNWSSTWALVY